MSSDKKALNFSRDHVESAAVKASVADGTMLQEASSPAVKTDAITRRKITRKP
jgi:hypothetical protein